MIREQVGGRLRQLRFAGPALRLVWRADRRHTTWWFALLAIQGILPVAVVYLTAAAVDDLAAAVDDGERATLVRALVTVGLLAGVIVAQALLTGVNRWVQTAQSEQVTDHVKQQVHEQAIRLDMSYYETPDYFDMLERARTEATTMPLSLIQNLGRLLQNGITLVAMMGILVPFGVWVPFALLLGTLPALLVVMRVSVRTHAWRHRRAPLMRRIVYYDRLLTDQAPAAEVRIFGLGSVFIERFQQARARMRREQLDFVRQEVVAEVFAAFLGLLTIGATMGILIYQTVDQGGSLGEIALFYQALNQGQKLAATLLGSVGQIHRNLLFLENLFVFLGLEPRLPEPVAPAAAPTPFVDAIELRDVGFTYPGSDRPALERFSLTIPAGRTVAIVGENGAGKTTLIKLLTRLYDPDTGSILLDGTDLRELPLDELRRLYTVLFQTPVRYELSAHENIAFGDWPAEPDADAVRAAAQAAGGDVPIDKLPDGYATILSKQFGGAELSVGEWQRIALSRAFLREAPVIILDEPTSAMDSWAEAAWLDRFTELARGRTAVIITHRFTTARRADVIHVMIDGRLVESGSHDELLAADGPYARSWREQAGEPRS